MQYILKDLFINTDTRTVRRGDDLLKVTELSFNVLVALIECSPQPVDSEKLASVSLGKPTRER